MTLQESYVCNIINNLNSEIVSLGSREGHNRLMQFIIPDDNGRTDNVFVRQSPLSLPVLVYFLLRHSPLSTQISLERFFWALARQSVNKSAVSQRRSRLDPAVFEYLNDMLCRKYYSHPENLPRKWHGWSIMAADGSDFMLPDTDDLADTYGRYSYSTPGGRKDKSFPMAKCVMYSDISSGLTLMGELFRYNEDDRNCFMKMLPEIYRRYGNMLCNSISIFDRGFYSMLLMYRMNMLDMKYVIRVTVASGRVRDFIASGKVEQETDWMPSYDTSLSRDPEWKESGCKPLHVRLVRVGLPNGQVEVLMTNLTPREVPASQMKELYFKRWGIEVELMHYKHVYEIEAFTGARTICVRQDFYAVLLIHNIICMLINAAKAGVESDNRLKKHDYKTNTAIFAGIFFALFVDIFIRGNPHHCMDVLLSAAREYLVPIRGGRAYPRVRKKRKSSDRNHTRTNRKRVI